MPYQELFDEIRRKGATAIYQQEIAPINSLNSSKPVQVDAKPPQTLVPQEGGLEEDIKSFDETWHKEFNWLQSSDPNSSQMSIISSNDEPYTQEGVVSMYEVYTTKYFTCREQAIAAASALPQAGYETIFFHYEDSHSGTGACMVTDGEDSRLYGATNPTPESLNSEYLNIVNTQTEPDKIRYTQK